MSEKNVKLLFLPPNADLDALSSIYGLWLLNKDAKLYYKTLAPKAKKLFETIKYKFDIITFEELKNEDSKFIIFTADVSSIDFIYEDIDKKNIEKIIIFDHHISNIAKTDNIELHLDDRLGAATTIVVETIMNSNTHITKEDAEILLCGIYDDTNYFSTKSTSSKDFKIASFLIDKGADLEFVNNHTKILITLQDIFNIEKTIKSLEIINIYNKRFGFMHLEGAKEEIVDNLKSIKELEELDAYFIIMESGINTYVIGRSKNLDIWNILSKIGGGGHRLASGLKLNYISYQKLKNIIINLLQGKNIKIKLKDIMTQNPLILEADVKIPEALKILSDYKLSKAPVIEKERIIGVITKKILTKANTLIPDSSIRDFTVEVPIMQEDDFVWEAEKMFIEYPLSPMLVITDEYKKLKGIVTKSDLIKFNIVENENTISQKHINIPDYILELAMEFKQFLTKDQKLYLVGGIVRDIILKRYSNDIDFVLEGEIDSFEKALSKGNIKIHKFKKFNSIHFKYKDFKIEISNARREYYESSGAYPIVSQASLKEDLFRRDFTINTMLISLNDEDFGNIIDHFGALQDINNKIIRVLHPLSFIEDPVRILRAIRFKAKLNFRFSKDTSKLLEDALLKNVLKNAPKGRIFNEIKLSIQEKEFEKIFELYKEYNIFKHIFDYEPNYINIEQNLLNLKKFSDWYFLEYKEEFSQQAWIYFWLLIKNIPNKQNILKDISAPHYLYRFLELNKHLKEYTHNISKTQKPSELYLMLKQFTIEDLGLLCAEGNLETMNKIVKYLSYFKDFKPNIDISVIEPKMRSQVIEKAKLIEMDKNYSL